MLEPWPPAAAEGSWPGNARLIGTPGSAMPRSYHFCIPSIRLDEDSGQRISPEASSQDKEGLTPEQVLSTSLM